VSQTGASSGHPALFGFHEPEEGGRIHPLRGDTPFSQRAGVPRLFLRRVGSNFKPAGHGMVSLPRDWTGFALLSGLVKANPRPVGPSLARQTASRCAAI
jgi:hypothetical protein